MSKKKEKVNQYTTSPVGNQVMDYRVYVMSPIYKILYIAGSFVLGGLVGLIFFGGLFKSDGVATQATNTSNLVFFMIFGVLAYKLFNGKVNQMLLKRRQNTLKRQFRDFLDAFATSLSSGMNVVLAVRSTYSDLVMQYSENAYITREVNEMLIGINNNIPVEDMLMDLGERSGIDDIKNFAIVFSVASPAGGNLADIIHRTNDIISEKIMISQEIETTMTSNKMQMNIMFIIPILMVLMLRMMSTQFSKGFASFVGVVGMGVAVIIFLLAFKLGNKMINIEE